MVAAGSGRCYQYAVAPGNQVIIAYGSPLRCTGCEMCEVQASCSLQADEAPDEVIALPAAVQALGQRSEGFTVGRTCGRNRCCQTVWSWPPRWGFQESSKHSGDRSDPILPVIDSPL